MKKLLVLLLCLLVVVGCGKKEGEEKQDTETPKLIDTKDEFSGYRYVESITCDALSENIKYFNFDSQYSNGWFVTEDNEAYYFDLLYKFSDETNCRKYDGEFPEIIYTERMEDGSVRLFNEAYHQVVLKFEDSEVKVITVNYSNSSYLHDIETRIPFRRLRNKILKDNNLSNIQLVPKTYASSLTSIYAIDYYAEGYYTPDFNNDTILNGYLTDYEEVFKVKDYNEVIMDFYYVTNDKYENGEFNYTSSYDTLFTIYSENMYVKTNKAYYRYMVKDDKCYEYLDIPCEYALIKDDELSEIVHDIVYRDSIMMILSNGRIFYI